MSNELTNTHVVQAMTVEQIGKPQYCNNTPPTDGPIISLQQDHTVNSHLKYVDSSVTEVFTITLTPMNTWKTKFQLLSCMLRDHHCILLH